MNYKVDTQAYIDWIRCTFAVKGEKPVLLMVNKLKDSLDSLIQTLVKHFWLNTKLEYWLTLESGAIIEHISYLEYDDKVIIEEYASAYVPFPMNRK